MLKPATILIVDDEPALCEVLEKVLSKEGYHVLTATTGRRALSIVQKERVDLVLLDLMMPGLGGLEVLEKMHSMKKRLPAVIIVTAYGSLASAREAMTLGAADYLTKPFDLEDVKRAIGEALSG